MSKRLLILIVALAAVGGVVALGYATSQRSSRDEGGETRPQQQTNSAIPRTPDGHPDFTGAWDVNGIENIDEALAPGSQIVHTPYGAERFKKVDQALDPNARCLPWGPTRMMCCTRHPDGFVQHKDVIAILTESQQTFRLIYMDGRPVPEDLIDRDGQVDPQVGGWMGFSRGHWDGDKLVVETVGADDRTWLDGHGGHEHSTKMKLTETFELKDANTIAYTGTVDDAVFYQKPWTFLKTIKRLTPPDRIMSHSCVENELDLAYMKPGAVVGGGQR